MSEEHDFNIKELEINPLLEKLRVQPTAGKSNNIFFKSFDGTKIFYRTWKPSKEINKIIIISHGMAGHGEFFILLADQLINHGIMIIAPDYRNHGYSEGKKGDLKKIKGILKDLHCLIKIIKEKYKKIPIFLFGESMGGTVSINFANEYADDFSEVSGLILFAPAVKLNFPKVFWVGISLLIPLILIIRLIIPSKGIIPAKGREEQGIKNPIHQQYDKEDPLHLDKVSIRYLIQIFKHIRKTKKIASKMLIPTIIFQGTDDKGIDPNGVRSFYNHLESKDKKIILVEDGYHALLTDPSFIDKWSILISWLKKH